MTATIKITRPAVVCVDGPLEGRWYYADDFAAMQRAAKRMGHTPAEPPGVALGYVEDGERTETHPSLQAVGETTARRMMWRPGTATRRETAQEWGRSA